MAGQAPLKTQTIAFGAFRLLPAQQLLLEGDERVAIGSRALDILVALAERAGDVVSKEELIARVWPDTVVEDGNLRVHIAGLRRALRDGQRGARYVTTIAGRGYSFVAPVSIASAAATNPLSPPDARSNVPIPLTRPVGRDNVIAALATQLAEWRLVTVVGPGGIGKTTVAMAVARFARDSYRDGIRVVDLSAVAEPHRVPGAIAVALGLEINADDISRKLITFLQQKEVLLLLDSCEHVVEAAAAMAEDLFRNVPVLHILATSREPLRSAGEYVHRLLPLPSPPASAKLTAAEAISFSGVQLFVERAAAALDGFELVDADAAFVADICRRLDGIPLAIELAAGRVDAFGVRGLSAELGNRFQILTSGRRTALPRHRTLAATLDWSYQLLPESERLALRSLAVFVGDFSLHAAVPLVPGLAPSQTVDLIANLVSKSLVVASPLGKTAHYRLLDTARLYGLEKLAARDELPDARRRHAAYIRDFFSPAEDECETRSKADWLARYGGLIDNVRAALDWAFAAGGDAQLGVAVAVAVVPLWVQLSLMIECHDQAKRALTTLGEEDATTLRSRMRLSASLGWSLMFASGRTRESSAAWVTVLEIAERLGDTSYRLRGLWGLWVNHLNQGRFRPALEAAQQFAGLVTGCTDTLDLMMAERMVGTSLHYLGEQARAREHIERTIRYYDSFPHQPRIARFQFDQRVTARYFQARILWLQGFPDRAMRIVALNIEEAEAINHALSLGSVLGQGACLVALFTGNLVAARRYGTMLLNHSERHGLGLWHGWARCFEGLLTARLGDLAAGLRIMRTEIDRAGDARSLPRYLVLLGEYAARLGDFGEIAAALAALDDLLARCERAEERWYLPELLRMKGERILASDVPDAVAERHFAEAIHLAKQQGALSWALRASTSLARLRFAQGRMAEGRQVVLEQYGQFSEGHATADLRTAQQFVGQ